MDKPTHPWQRSETRPFDEILDASPVREWMKGRDPKFLSKGFQHRVYLLKREGWVMKEARWDLDVALFQSVTLPLYAQLTEDVLKQFSFTFLPTPEHMRRQHARYLQASEYLGYGSTEGQRSVRERLKTSAAMILPDTPAFHESLARAYASAAATHDFLPEEHLHAGESFSPENKGKRTFFYFQEFLPGTPLHDCDLATLREDHSLQLMVFLGLLVMMYEEIGLVPDTRPRYVLTQAASWLAKTDNILIGEKGVKFIDTGWFWERHAPIVRRGFILPEHTVHQARHVLKSLLSSARNPVPSLPRL